MVVGRCKAHPRGDVGSDGRISQGCVAAAEFSNDFNDCERPVPAACDGVNGCQDLLSGGFGHGSSYLIGPRRADYSSGATPRLIWGYGGAERLGSGNSHQIQLECGTVDVRTAADAPSEPD
jgi:hypothetical protein